MTHREVSDRNFAPRLRRPNESWNFAWKLDPGPLTKTKTPDVFVKFLIANTDGELGRDDVARFNENVFDAQIGKRGVIVQRGAAVVPDSVFAKDVGIEAKLVLIERGRGGDDFKRRTRLHHVADRAIFILLRFFIGAAFVIERWQFVLELDFSC